MYKRFLFLFFFVLLAQIILAQVAIQPIGISSGIVQKSQLWNLIILNSSSNTYTCRLELVMKDRQTGLDAMTATTNSFSVAAGSGQLSESVFQPIVYNDLGSGLSSQLQGIIKYGNYSVCYSLFAENEKDNKIAEECITMDVEPSSPPMLIFPSDSAELDLSPTLFSWVKPMPDVIFERLSSEVRITEILDGQQPLEALQNNPLIFSANGIADNSLSYSNGYNVFKKEKWYAWQVTTTDENRYSGQSEAWVFKIKQESEVEKIIRTTPWIKMKKNNSERTIAPNGVLKFTYDNLINDSSAMFLLRIILK